MTSEQELLLHLENGGAVVTATSRLARFLSMNYADAMVSLGRSAWSTPDTLPVTTWLSRIVAEGAESPDCADVISSPLSTTQEQVLWEQGLQETIDEHYLFRLESMASLMMRSFAIEQAWRVDVANSPNTTEDTELYLRIRGAVLRRCEQERVFPLPMLWSYALRVINEMHVRQCAAGILFAGFDLDVPRALLEIESALRRRGIAVRWYEQEPLYPVQARAEFATREDELLAAANWARELLLRGERNIGVVLPRLEEQRTSVERIFADTFFPGGVVHERDDDGLFELSLGNTLAREALVNAAMQALDLLRPIIRTEVLGRVLRSPFFRAYHTHAGLRARIDALLRSKKQVEMKWTSLSTMLRQIQECDNDSFIGVLFERPRPDDLHHCAFWADLFLDTLNALGWPGDRQLSSREYQVRVRFLEQFTVLSSLDALLGPIPLGDALNKLWGLLSGIVFQPRSRNMPVQVLGVRETAGIRFRHLWLGDMCDEAWPPRASAVPFLPLDAQRRAGLPAAIPERNFKQFEHVTHRLLSSAENIVVSSARLDGDREIHPAPMIPQMPDYHPPPPIDSPAKWMRATAPNILESCIDDTAPPVARFEKLKGGVQILTLQSACPFRAFATLRLHATALEHPVHGLTPIDRGNIVHNVLQRIWTSLRDSQALLDAGSDDVIDTTINAVIDQQRLEKTDHIPGHFFDAERECVRRLLLEWIGIERMRPSFSVVDREAVRSITLGGITLSLRLDRIDRLPDGNFALIDYKTSMKNPGDWMQKRPREPQLPLYAIASRESVSAVAFAVLRRGACAFTGLTADPAVFPQLHDVSEWTMKVLDEKLSWNSLLDGWNDTLSSLATDFAEGVAIVDPRDGDTCTYCTLHSLCRIDEFRLDDGDIDDENTNDDD